MSNITVSTSAGSGSYATSDGTGTVASFEQPEGICVDYSGTYAYVVDSAVTTAAVRQIIIASGVTSTILTGRSWSGNMGLACDGSGNIFPVSSTGYYVVKATLSQIQTAGSTGNIVAGQSGVSGSTDSTTGTSATFSTLYFVSFDAAFANLYIADYGNNRIRTMSTSNSFAVTTIATATSVISVVVDSTYIYTIRSEGYAVYREKLSSCTGSSFTISTYYAGTGSQGFNDGTLSYASFYKVYSLSIDASSNLYVLDMNGLRLVSYSALLVTTLAGIPSTSGYVDGSGSVARFTSYGGYAGISRSDSAHLYVADMHNRRIRLISCASGYSLLLGACGMSDVDIFVL